MLPYKEERSQVDLTGAVEWLYGVALSLRSHVWPRVHATGAGPFQSSRRSARRRPSSAQVSNGTCRATCRVGGTN